MGEVDFFVVITVLTFPHVNVFFVTCATRQLVQDTVTSLLNSKVNKLVQGLKVNRVPNMRVQILELERFLDEIQVWGINMEEALAFVGLVWRYDVIPDPVATVKDLFMILT